VSFNQIPYNHYNARDLRGYKPNSFGVFFDLFMILIDIFLGFGGLSRK